MKWSWDDVESEERKYTARAVGRALGHDNTKVSSIMRSMGIRSPMTRTELQRVIEEVSAREGRKLLRASKLDSKDPTLR